jgi:PAS domain-containing protein
MPQAGDEFAAQFAHGMGIDGGIDRFVRHLELALVREDPLAGSRYLLRRPLPAQHSAHYAPAHALRLQLAAAPCMASAGCSAPLRVVRTGVLPSTGVAGQLASNSGRRSFQCAGNRSHTAAPLSHGGNGNAVLGLKLLVSGLFLHVHTLQEKVLHFRFEATPFILQGICIDIQPLKAVEQELAQKTKRLEFTLESAQIGDWNLDLVNGIWYRSLRHDQRFGYTEPIRDWGFETFIQHVQA